MGMSRITDVRAWHRAWCRMDRCHSPVTISVGESTWRARDPFGDPETLDLSSSEGARCPRVVKTKFVWEQECLECKFKTILISFSGTTSYLRLGLFW